MSIGVPAFVKVESVYKSVAASAAVELFLRRVAAVANIELASTWKERVDTKEVGPRNNADMEEAEDVDEGVGVAVLLCEEREDAEGIAGAGKGIT